MRRTAALLLALLMLLSLCACGKKPAPEAPADSPAAATPAPTPDPAPTPSPAPAVTPEPPPLVPELPEVHDEALAAVFEEVLTVYPGSAGSSLRAVACAAHLLDWGSETALSDDEIYSAVGCWLDGQDDRRLQIFLENILTVYDRCYDLKGEHAQELMEDAGVSDSAWPWNDRAFRAVEMVSYGCGLR